MSTYENVDPLDLEPARKLMIEKTFQVYSKTWLCFVSFAGITVEKLPEEKDFERFIEHKRTSGLCGSTMRSVYSHLNKFMIQLYNKRLGVS